MTMSAGTTDASAMKKMHGLRTNALGLPVALRPVAWR